MAVLTLPPAAQRTTGVVDFIRNVLPKATLLELYTEEKRGIFVCRAVLQQLSPVAQQVCVRLSCTGGQFPLAGVQIWTSLNEKQQDTMLRELFGWGIVTEKLTIAKSKQERGTILQLTDQFAQGLKASLCCLDASPWKPLQPKQIAILEKEAGEKPIQTCPEDLERYTQRQWDIVLHFLVGTVGLEEPPPAVAHLLLETGLMQPDPDFSGNPDQAPLVITQNGYDFMLKDNHQQVWHFVVQYLKSLESHTDSEQLIREAILLLVCLSFAQVGSAYLASSLNKECRFMVKHHLSFFGLIYTRKIGKSTIFYPTKIALQLVGSNSTTAASDSTLWSLSSKALESALAYPNPKESSHLAIIVQTNFQICGYTTSELHVSMMGLFCDVQTIRRLPNVVFMHMTRDSVKSAFQLGIQAAQILRFLEKHAHPKLRESGNLTNLGSSVKSPIPANVVDQIWLWDRERSRVTLGEVFQHNCVMSGEFQAVVQYAKDKGAYSWSSENKQMILLKYQHAPRMQKFVRQWRAKAASREE